jgi:hypothetical protein
MHAASCSASRAAAAQINMQGRDSIARDSLGSASSGQPPVLSPAVFVTQPTPMHAHFIPAATADNDGGIACEAGRMRLGHQVRASYGQAASEAWPRGAKAGHARTGATLMASLLAGNQSLTGDFMKQDVPQSHSLKHCSDHFSSEPLDEFDF